MGMPDRFAIEYPRRALEFIGILEAPAVITIEETFLQIVKSLAEWIGSLDLDRRLAAAA